MDAGPPSSCCRDACNTGAPRGRLIGAERTSRVSRTLDGAASAGGPRSYNPHVSRARRHHALAVLELRRPLGLDATGASPCGVMARFAGANDDGVPKRRGAELDALPVGAQDLARGGARFKEDAARAIPLGPDVAMSRRTLRVQLPRRAPDPDRARARDNGGDGATEEVQPAVATASSKAAAERSQATNPRNIQISIESANVPSTLCALPQASNQRRRTRRQAERRPDAVHPSSPREREPKRADGTQTRRRDSDRRNERAERCIRGDGDAVASSRRRDTRHHAQGLRKSPGAKHVGKRPGRVHGRDIGVSFARQVGTDLWRARRGPSSP